jgi:hypothetical protein
MAMVALLCLTDLTIKWDDLCQQLINNGFDRYDYAAMKFLILFDAGMCAAYVDCTCLQTIRNCATSEQCWRRAQKFATPGPTIGVT